MSLEDIPIARLRCLPQVRQQFDPESEALLIESLKKHGQLVPARGYRESENIVLEDGERRLRAAKAAGLAHLRVLIIDRAANEAETLLRQHASNCQREGLSALEQAQAIHTWMSSTKSTAKQAAEAFCIPTSTVSQLLAILKLPAPLQSQVAQGEISRSAAYELSKVSDESKREELASRIRHQNLSRDAIVGMVKSSKRCTREATKTNSRVRFQLPSGAGITVEKESLDLESFIEALEDLLARARKARTQGLELTTLSRMLRDQISKKGA